MKLGGLVVVSVVSASCAMSGPSPRTSASTATDPAPHWSRLRPLGNLHVPLLHARLSGTGVPYEDVAGSFPEVQTAGDEFQRRDRISEVQAKIDRANAALDGTKSFRYRRSLTLPDYDFVRQGFPLPLHDAPFLLMSQPFTAFRTAYAVALTNGSRFGFMPVPEAAARRALGRDFMRGAELDLELEPISADTRPVTGLDTRSRVLWCRVLRVRLVSQNQTLGELALDGPPGAAAGQ